jgi:hypothetical protein
VLGWIAGVTALISARKIAAPPRDVEPPADAEGAGEQEVAKAELGVDVASERMYRKLLPPALPQRTALTVRIAPWSSMRARARSW